MNTKEPVRLRQKPLKNGGKSLYLDIYQDGVRRYEYLKLYINPGNDPAIRAKNKAALEAARVIQAKRLVDIETGAAEILTAKQRKTRFTDYYREYFENRPNVSPWYRESSKYVLLRWVDYAGEAVLLSRITPQLLAGFIKFLREEPNTLCRRRGVKISSGPERDAGIMPTREAETLVWDLVKNKNKRISEVSAMTGINASSVLQIVKRMGKRGDRQPLSGPSINRYFTYIKTVINDAARKGLITINPVAQLNRSDMPSPKGNERTFLTIEEVGRLADTPCQKQVVKDMFLFSCFTGLRLSDVEKLSWENIDNEMIHLTQQKTSNPVYIPISKNASRWLPERTDEKGLVFQDIPVRNTINRTIVQWTKDAGINKHVTFHSARHSFATLAITFGADIYTVSKLLGHTQVSTTQIYAKIVDEKKREAVNLIPEI